VVSGHGSTLGLDGWNVFVMHACRVSMCLLCMHVSGHCYNCVSMQGSMFLLLGCVCHEFMLVLYAFVMHVSVYMLLCMHCHGYSYACIVGQTCIVRPLYVVGVAKMEEEMQTIRTLNFGGKSRSSYMYCMFGMLVF